MVTSRLPADARDLPAGEPHARAGVGGAPSRCWICHRIEGHYHELHVAYFQGRSQSLLAIIAGVRTAAEARKHALDEIAKIEADPMLGVRPSPGRPT